MKAELPSGAAEITRQRCEAVAAYKERLIMELTIMGTRRQLAVVKGAIRRIRGFV